MSDRRYIDAPAEAIEAAGRALFDETWHTGLSDLLGWDKSRLRQMLRGDRPMPAGALDDILRALHDKERAITGAVRELEKTMTE